MKPRRACTWWLGAAIVGCAISYGAAARPVAAGQPERETKNLPVPAPEMGEESRPESFAQREREVRASITEARRLLPSNPEAAEAILEAARKRVASSGLAPAEKQRLERLIDATAGYTRQLLAMDQRNQAIRDRVRFERGSRVEVDQILSDEVDRFEQLLRAGRFPEAEALALDLWDLSPGNPAVEAMIGKLRFAPYHFDLSFGALYPYSYVDPFAFDYYPYTVPWHNYRERVYVGPYLRTPEGGRRGEGNDRSEPPPQPAPREPETKSHDDEPNASSQPRAKSTAGKSI